MSENQEELKRIELKTESGTIRFDDHNQLRTWINEQRTLYNFHGNVSQKFSLQAVFQKMDQGWNQLNQLVSNSLQPHVNSPANYNANVDKFITQFDQLRTQKAIFTSDAPHSAFITRQGDKRSEYGISAIAEIYEHNIQNIDKFALEGLEQAKEYINGSDERIEDESNKLDELKLRWDEELETHKQDWVTQFSEEVQTARSINEESSEILTKWREQIKTNTDELANAKDGFKEQYTKAFENSRVELEQITVTYDAKLALQASVRYWGLQKKHHDSKSVQFGIALFTSAILVVAGLILFSNSVLDESLKDVHLSRIFTAAVLTTFGIWLVKILANIFMSHLHLATDAQERRTMIHTYLALTRKGHGPKEEDRQLILQTLFRPSTSGMVKDDAGPTQLVDMVNRLASRNPN